MVSDFCTNPAGVLKLTKTLYITMHKTETSQVASADTTYCLQAWQEQGEGEGDGSEDRDDDSQQEGAPATPQLAGSAGGHQQTERSQNHRDLNHKVDSQSPVD